MDQMTDLNFKATVFALRDHKKHATPDQLRAFHLEIAGEDFPMEIFVEKCQKFLRAHPTIKNTYTL